MRRRFLKGDVLLYCIFLVLGVVISVVDVIAVGDVIV